jgi:endonuclease-8
MTISKATSRTFMPEGDSIYRLAAKLRPKLVGGRVRAFEAHGIADAVTKTVIGHEVVAVEARGKNLLVHFDDGRALHVHLRMLGRLAFERPRSAFWRPRVLSHQLRLDVEGAVLVGDRIPVLRLLRVGGVERAPDLRGLGPDLLAPDFDEDECVARLRALGEQPIGEALLVQHALAGIGNIYKSETLFLEGVAPTASVASLDDAKLHALVNRASTLLRANVGTAGPLARRSLGAGDAGRTTRPSLTGSKVWVYGRRGKACFRCGTVVEMIRQGAPPGRSTYHCRGCQRLS